MKLFILNGPEKGRSFDLKPDHTLLGRYAQDSGANPVELLPPEADPVTGGPYFVTHPVSLQKTGKTMKLAAMYGSRTQHGRSFALSISLDKLRNSKDAEKHGLTMDDYPLTLPLPEGYDAKRDFYPPHDHDTYRWSMVVDLDKCIGCGNCAQICPVDVVVVDPPSVSPGDLPPAKSTSVGRTSQYCTSASVRCPAAIVPGQRAINAVCSPVSQFVHLQPGNCDPCSDVNSTSVSFALPCISPWSVTLEPV